MLIREKRFIEVNEYSLESIVHKIEQTDFKYSYLISATTLFLYSNNYYASHNDAGEVVIETGGLGAYGNSYGVVLLAHSNFKIKSIQSISSGAR